MSEAATMSEPTSTTKPDDAGDKRTASKRKKKRSSMQMAKKYARRSERGHGSELDPDTYQYMVRILDMLRQDFATMDEKLVFVENVYEQTIGHEYEYARNQVGSRVLDSLVEFASHRVVRRLADALAPSLRPACSDRFASHVLQKLIHVCAERGTRRVDSEKLAAESKTEGEGDAKDSAKVAKDPAKVPKDSAKVAKDSVKIEPSEIPEYNEVALRLCRYAINNFEEFSWDTYANHVLRTSIESLGGVLDRDKDAARRRETPNFESRRSVPQEYTDLLLDAGNRFLKWPQLAEFGKDELTSGLLQSLLRTLKGVDSKLNAALMKRIINECFTENTESELSTIFRAESSIRLLEVCLAVAKPKMSTRLYRRFFAGRLRELSLMSGANFAVQRLLDNCASKEETEEIFEELSEHFSAILDRRNTGVLASLANACGRLQCKQGPFVNSITKALGCDESTEAQLRIVPVVATLRTYEKILENEKSEAAKLPVHLHGSIAVQAMLRFNKPIKIVNSLLAMSGDELVGLLSDPKGSRILDAFMDSRFIGEKSREKLAKNLQGNWANLARGVHGSRCLDRIWIWAKPNQRYWIMEELAAVGEAINSTKTGKLIAAKLNVPLYARNKKDWSEAQGKVEKTKALFAGIIDATALKT